MQIEFVKKDEIVLNLEKSFFVSFYKTNGGRSSSTLKNWSFPHIGKIGGCNDFLFEKYKDIFQFEYIQVVFQFEKFQVVFQIRLYQSNNAWAWQKWKCISTIICVSTLEKQKLLS